MTVTQSKQRQNLNNQKNGSKSMQIECTFHFYGFNIQLRITLVKKVENFEIDKVLVSCRGSMHVKQHIKASTLRFYIKVYHTKERPALIRKTIKKAAVETASKAEFF